MQLNGTNLQIFAFVATVASGYAVSEYKSEAAYDHVKTYDTKLDKHSAALDEIKMNFNTLKTNMEYIKLREQEFIAVMEKQTNAINKLSRIIAAEIGANKFD